LHFAENKKVLGLHGRIWYPIGQKFKKKIGFQFLNLSTLKITDFEIFFQKFFWADGVKGITFFEKR